MFLTLESPHTVAKMPVQIARSLDEMNYGVERGEIAPPSFINIINEMADWCQRIHNVAFKNMTRKAAVGICKELKPHIPELLAEEEAFNKRYDGIYGEAIVATARLFENVRILIGEAIFIANGKKIADEELDAFLVDYVNRRPRNIEGRVNGKKAVMALFD